MIKNKVFKQNKAKVNKKDKVKNKCYQKIKNNWQTILAVFLSVIVMFYYVDKKQGYHEDEMFSYGSSNYKYDNVYRNYGYAQGNMDILYKEVIGSHDVNKLITFLKDKHNNNYPEFNGYVNNKLFVSKIIKDYEIKFPKNIIVWEDMLFVVEYLYHCKTITVIGDNLYFYRQRKTSVKHYRNKLRKSLKSKIYVSKQILKKSDFSYHLYKDFGYWYLRYNLAYLKHKVLDKQF